MKGCIGYIKFICKATTIPDKILLLFYIVAIVVSLILDEKIWTMLSLIILGQALEMICQNEINKEFAEKINTLLEAQSITYDALIHFYNVHKE